MKKMISIAVLLLIILTLLQSCNTTEPLPTKKPENPREYTWTIDTLNIPDAFQNMMSSIWGSSASDIYICGHHSGSDIYPHNGDMWHYNGKNWSVVDIYGSGGGSGKLSAVHGSSPTNVWAVGYYGRRWNDEEFNVPFITHYDGSRWEDHKVDTKHATYGVYVEGENNVWACGDGGLVYHYDGNDWTVDTIKVPMQENDFFIIYTIVRYNGEMYVTGVNRESGSVNTQYYFFKKENNIWKQLDKFDYTWENSNKFGNRLKVVAPNKLLSFGSGGIYIWENNQWQIFYKTIYSVNSLYAQKENSIIAVGSSDTRYHYNGNDWQVLDAIKATDILYFGVWATEDEVFIIGTTSVGTQAKTIVLHGK